MSTAIIDTPTTLNIPDHMSEGAWTAEVFHADNEEQAFYEGSLLISFTHTCLSTVLNAVRDYMLDEGIEYEYEVSVMYEEVDSDV